MLCRDVKAAVSYAGLAKKNRCTCIALVRGWVEHSAGAHSSRDWGNSLRKSLETVQGVLEEDGLHSLELRVRKGGRCDNSL